MTTATACSLLHLPERAQVLQSSTGLEDRAFRKRLKSSMKERMKQLDEAFFDIRFI